MAATAWYGKPLVYTKIVPADGSPVKAFSGMTLECWDVCGGLYDLLADENGRGIVFNLNDVPAGKYVLSWKRQARPDGGNADYCVRIKGDETKIAEKSYAAPERTQEQGSQKIQFYFELKDCFSKLAIAFDPSGAGTKGALVGGFEIGVPVKLLSVDFVPAGDCEPLFLTKDDGTPFSSGAPVVYVSGQNPAVKPVPDSGVEPEAFRVKYDGYINLKDENENYWLVLRGENQEIVPAGTVCYFENFQLEWEACYGGDWVDAGTTSNELYFTRAAPRTDLRQETLFWIACAAPVSGNDDPEKILREILRKFSNDDKAPANIKNKNGAVLKYWGDWYRTPEYFTTSDLLKYHTGRCGAWADFFVDVLKVQGIIAFRTIIFPPTDNEAFVMKNYILERGNDGSGERQFPYVVDWANEDFENNYAGKAYGLFVDAEGIAGQNNGNPVSLFKSRDICLVGGYFFDPSYGIKVETTGELQEKLVFGYADLTHGFGAKIDTPDGEIFQYFPARTALPETDRIRIGKVFYRDNSNFSLEGVPADFFKGAAVVCFRNLYEKKSNAPDKEDVLMIKLKK